MSENFTISEYNLEEIARAGSGSIPIRVRGYWSRDPITLYINRRFMGHNGGWSVQLSHSSGGRDSKEVENDLIASQYFAHAMIALAQEGLKISEQFVAMERFYQDERAKRAAEYEAQRKAQQALYDGDRPFGMSRAQGIIESMYKGHRGQTLEVYERGSNKVNELKCVRSYGRTSFYFNDHRKSKTDIVALLANSSTREVHPQFEAA